VKSEGGRRKEGKKKGRQKNIIIFVLCWGAAIPEPPKAGMTRQYPAVERSDSFLEEKCVNMGLSGGLYAIIMIDSLRGFSHRLKHFQNVNIKAETMLRNDARENNYQAIVVKNSRK